MQVYAITTTPATGGEERETIEPIKCTRLQHTAIQVESREKRHRANQVYTLTTHQLQVESRKKDIEDNQVYGLTTHQLQVERREVIEPIKCMLSPHTSYRWKGRGEI